MIQDIGELKYHCEYKNRKPDWQKDYLLAYRGNEIFLCDNKIPTLNEALQENDMDLRYLFSISDVAFFMPKNENCGLKQIGYTNTRVIRTMQPQWMAFAAITGHHLYTWYSENQFCGKCSTKLVHKENERALKCPKCGKVIYPNISEAVIVAITNGDKLLVSRYAGGNQNHYALIAGYVEIGESLEATVHREVMEETGLKVKNLQYFASQPWGFSRTLLAGFFAELDGSDEIKLDENELAEAKWLSREELPENNNGISLTSQMMESFRTEK